MEKILLALLRIIFDESETEARLRRFGIVDWSVSYKNGPDIIEFEITEVTKLPIRGYADLTGDTLTITYLYDKKEYKHLPISKELYLLLRGI